MKRVDLEGARQRGADAPDDELALHRRRFFRRALLGTPLAVVVMVVGFWMAGKGWDVMLFPTLFAVLGTPLAALSGRSEALDRLAYHLFGALVVLVPVAGAVVVGGGIGGPELLALPILPIIMSFLGGQRAAIVWTALSIVAIAALLAFQGQIPPSRFDAADMKLTHGGVLMTCLVISLTVGLAYVSSTESQSAALARSRDEARAANAAKSAFLATMSHEIRTPLAGIVGLTDLLEASPLGRAQPREIQLLRQTSTALTALIGDVLDLARIEAGRLELHPAPLDVVQLHRDVLGLFSASAERKGINLEGIAPASPVWVLVDGGRLRQVLVNLVSNAVKFTDRGRVNVELAAEKRGAELALLLSVNDTGPGIASDQQRSLFEPFTQADSTHARHHQGSGLGLAIVRELCGLLGATVAVESQLGAGTTFTVELTVPEAEPVEAATKTIAPVGPGLDAGAPLALEPIEPAPRSDTPTATALRLLLVEDNEINQLVFGELLRSRGCDVRIAADGAAAIAAVEADPPDLVLMDMQMPDMDGLEATRRLRSAGSTVPVVALTANTLPEDREAARAAGMNGFLTKPLTREAMDELVQGRWPSLEPSA